MKKSLLTLAITGAMLSPLVAQADSTLYGVAQFRLNDVDNRDLDAQMAKTRLGVKGTVDNDIDGLTTGFQMEWEFQADAEPATDPTATGSVDLRKSLVFMKGDWGQVTFGRQNNPAQVAEINIASKHGCSFCQIPDRYGNAISYATLPRNGFELAGGVAMDAGDAGQDDVDASNVALSYNAHGIAAALAYWDVDGDHDVTAAKLAYTMGDLLVAATYEEKSFDTAGSNDLEIFALGGKYTMGKAKAYAEYQELDEENGSANDNDVVTVGLSYALGAQASVSAEYADFDSDTGNFAKNDELTLQYTLGF